MIQRAEREKARVQREKVGLKCDSNLSAQTYRIKKDFQMGIKKKNQIICPVHEFCLQPSYAEMLR